MKSLIRGILSILCIFLTQATLGAAPPDVVERAPGQPGTLPLERTWTLPPDAVEASKHHPAPRLDELPSYWRVEDGRSEKMTVLLSSGFEGSFPAVWNAFSQGAADVFWGRSTARSATGNASAWCAQRGSDAPAPFGDVPPNTESWMIAGPFDLSNTTSGELEFDAFLETESGFDFLFAAASTNGTNFTAFGTDQNTTGFERFVVDLTNWGDLGDLTDRSAVWFAFLYASDSSATFEGAYIDNVTLTTDTGQGSSGLNLIVNQIDAANCPQMQAIVSVLDDQGDPIPGLTEANFTLEEEGVQQTFTVDTPDTAGSSLAVTLVLDGSGSLSNGDISNIQAAGNEFIDLLTPGDQAAVYHFGSDVVRVQDYTTNRNAARNAVNGLTNNLGFTALFDAIVDAAEYSTTVGGRRALIVMTDGMNNNSSNSLQDAIDAARAAGVPVFTIGFGSADSQVLTRIAEETGGIFFEGVTSADLQTIFQQIGRTLNNQFILSWISPVRDGGVHDLTIQVRNQGASASRTTSYSQAGTPCANATGPCTPGPSTLCLNQDRFRVEVEWRDTDGSQGSGSVAACGSQDSGLFYFFDPDNWEMLVKVLDACGVNGHYWVFLAATTNLGYDLRVTDTATGVQRLYSNAPGVPAPAVTDTTAFATCP